MYSDLVNWIVAVIARLEGCRLTAYQDSVGVWTIGFGETFGVKEGMVWTMEEAKARLRVRVTYFLLQVLRRCPQLHLEPWGRSVACTSLAYNIGLGAFGASSVCRLTKYREYASAAHAFLLWNKAGGRVLKGLTFRRQQEMLIYLEKISGKSN